MKTQTKLLALMFLVIGKTRKVGVTSVLALVITFIVVNLGIKNIVARTRPYEVVEGLINLVDKQKDFSFYQVSYFQPFKQKLLKTKT